MESALNLKDLESHVIKTIIGSIVASLSVALITGFSFYYKTNNAIERLNESQTEIKRTVMEHTDLINKATTGMGMSDVQQKNFEQRLNNIESTQKEIYNMLIQIAANQKSVKK